MGFFLFLEQLCRTNKFYVSTLVYPVLSWFSDARCWGSNPFGRAKKRIAMYFCNALFGFMLFWFQNHFPLSGKMILLTKKKITIDTPPFKTVVPML